MNIEQKIKELKAKKESILEIIKSKDFTVDDIIYYGSELQDLSLVINELELIQMTSIS